MTFTIPITPPTPATAEDAGVAELSFEEPDWDDLVDGFDEASVDYDWHEDGLTPINGLDQLDEELRALIADELADLNAEARARGEAVGGNPPDTGPPDTTPPDTTPPQTGPPGEIPINGDCRKVGVSGP